MPQRFDTEDIRLDYRLEATVLVVSTNRWMCGCTPERFRLAIMVEQGPEPVSTLASRAAVFVEWRGTSCRCLSPTHKTRPSWALPYKPEPIPFVVCPTLSSLSFAVVVFVVVKASNDDQFRRTPPRSHTGHVHPDAPHSPRRTSSAPIISLASFTSVTNRPRGTISWLLRRCS